MISGPVVIWESSSSLIIVRFSEAWTYRMLFYPSTCCYSDYKNKSDVFCTYLKLFLCISLLFGALCVNFSYHSVPNSSLQFPHFSNFAKLKFLLLSSKLREGDKSWPWYGLSHLLSFLEWGWERKATSTWWVSQTEETGASCKGCTQSVPQGLSPYRDQSALKTPGSLNMRI